MLRPLPLVLFVALAAGCHPAYADIPAAAAKYQRLLTRSAHAHWGLDAPVATMAAQVHQESRWRTDARSPAGAQGLAQFMPTTATWFSTLYPEHLSDNQPYNAGWALRALVLYNRWLYVRTTGADNCQRWAFVLAAYNGGQKWVMRDKQAAREKGMDADVYFGVVEHINAGRSPAAWNENRDYSRLILLRHEPMYRRAGWGHGVCS